MLFRPTLLLSLLGAATSSSQVVNALPSRKLQAGDYEVVNAVQFHYNVGDGNGGTGTEINEPTVLLGFEHDDVTDVANTPSNPKGFIDVTHYEGGCKNVIEPGLAGSEIGGAVVQTPLVGNSANPSLVLATATGLSADYTITLNNGANSPPEAGDFNGVLTVIRYKLGLLDQDTRITQLSGGTEYVTKFCTRLSLMSMAGVEVGFREVDVTVRHEVDSVTQVVVTTTEEETTDIDEDFGDYTVETIFTTPGVTSPITPAPVTSAPAPSPLNQGEEFKLALIPKRTPDVGTEAVATEMDIISVDECFFWLDENGDQAWIQGELRQFVILGGEVVTPFASDLLCSEAAVEGADVNGCVFTVTLPSTFFSGTTSNVRGVCTVTLEFDGTSVSGRRELQLADGDQGQVTSSVGLVVAREAETDDDCWAGCFFLFCPLNIVICWIQEFFSKF